MTYALKIKSSTHGAGEQELTDHDPLKVAALAEKEENTHSFIKKYFKKDWRILEAGCGLGRWMLHLDDLGYKMTGIDISKSAIEKLKSVRPSLDLYTGDISAIPFEDNSFDAVLSVGVIEHDPNGPEKMLGEMIRVLKQNGIMIVIVPVENTLRTLIHRPLCFIRYSILNLFGRPLEFEEYRFSSSDIKRRILKTGLEIIESSWVELIDDDKSYSLWVDWGGMFHAKSSEEPFKMNVAGRFLKRLFFGISPWFISEGIVIAARKSEKRG